MWLIYASGELNGFNPLNPDDASKRHFASLENDLPYTYGI